MVILIAVVVVFWPSFSAGFIWDDDNMLTANGMIRGPLRDFWFSARALDYFPVTYTSLWLEWRLWGMNPMGYHITNVVLHALGCVVLWRAFVRLKFPAAWLAALLFAIHPVNVESVTWIAERKNVLAMLFYTITVWGFVRFVQSRERRFYIVSLIAFLLSLLAKPAAAPWPLVALGIAFWMDRSGAERATGNVRQRWTKYCLWAAPFFVATIVLSIVTVASQNGGIVAGDQMWFHADLLTRVEKAGLNVWFYLLKAVVPFPLMFVYPKWHLGGPVGALVAGVALIGVVAVFMKYRGTWGRPGLLALLYFLLLLTPVLGLFNVYFLRYSDVADHWQFFALPAVTVLIAFYLQKVKLHYWAGVALLLVFACLTFARCRVFHNDESVWQDTLAKNPTCSLALDQLGLISEQAGRPDEASKYFARSLEVEPNDPLTRVNLGCCFAMMGKVDDGMAQLRETIRRVPNSSYAYYEMGLMLRQQGKLDEAIQEFREAVQRGSGFLPSYNELGKTLWLVGKRDEAIAVLRKALDVEPTDVDALICLGAFLKDERKPSDGLPFLQKAVALEPGSADAHANFGSALWALNDRHGAQDEYTKALKLDPGCEIALYGMADSLRVSGQRDAATLFYEEILAKNPQHAESHFQLGMIRAAGNQKEVALAHFREAARLKPNWIEAVNNLAWFLATDPKSTPADEAQAVRLAQHAVELSGGRNPVAMDTLGVAWARNEVFSKATNAANGAIQVAVQTGKTNLVADIQKRLALYNQGRAYLEP